MGTIQTNQIYLMDCREGMRLIPDSFVDLIVTDPPFAIEFGAKRSNYNRTAGRVLEGYSEIPKHAYYEFTLSWMREAYRVLKETGSMYVFSGWNNLRDVLNALEEIGFVTVNHIIWKYQFGVFTKRRFVCSHYHCLYVCKNDSLRRFYPESRYPADARDSEGRSLRYQDMEDVWIIPREYWNGDLKTPTKLPSELVRKILQYSSKEGDLVMDPFLGSGQVAVVAKQMGRQYLGFEIVPEYYEFARRRLEEGVYRLKALEPNTAELTLPLE
ncbi:MAG: site-specific DNA-methyltransferase [Fimbriimonadales bacterium]|nr:site-specific DNA-methyltransferase [Fimbriimonadales bacterium]MCS7191165.1 site-specific DNA-methyltransferase [Fimbriimonadales bacterium]